LRAETSTQALGAPFNWTTPDGIQLVALYRAPKPDHWVWVLLHGLGSNKQEWLSFARQLVQEGDGFLIYDARGHGDSTTGRNGPVSYTDFRTAGSGSQWERMIGDLDGIVNQLKSRFKLDPRQIAVGGASLGANIAVIYASQHSDVPAIILLSPGLEYAGVQSEQAFRQYGSRPVLIAASSGDSYAAASVRQLVLPRKDPACRVISHEGAAHGVNMFDTVFTQKVMNWIRQVEQRPEPAKSSN